VYKPREERSYLEFHPGFDVEQPLLIFPAEVVDGENYKPPALPETKTVKILDIKEEEEMRKDMGAIPTREEQQLGTSDAGRTLSEASCQPLNAAEEHIPKPGPESATSPVSPASNGISSTAHINADLMLGTTNGDISAPFPIPTESITNGLPIDPALAALTPPPIPTIDASLSLPIDPALAMESHPPPAQTETPAATPTDGPLKDDGASPLARTPPPTTPAAQDTGPSPVKRGMNDVPTLASLRAHRTTAGKPPPRSLPPASARKPRGQGRAETQEKLHLREPSFRKIKEFKFPEKMSEKMLAVGYQNQTRFECPPTLLRDQPDLGVDEELDSISLDLVEYDMDQQDGQWLNNYNSKRMIVGDNEVSPEVFEFAMTKIEKEWVNLERKMPKVQAKPHGGTTNRRRSGRVGEEDDDEEGGEDSKCAICDDGECENANAIVFCDGCNLAVHQECYGVPYIPEGQWHCRKCQQIPRQTAVCILLPCIDIGEAHYLKALCILPEHGWGLQANDHQPMGSPALCDMDSRSQTGKSSIHGAGRGCGERAKVTLEVGE
jgi:NuA3 HAT complex component NTO1